MTLPAGHTAHEHEQSIAMFGECPTCIAAAANAAPPQAAPRLPSPTPAYDGATYRPDLDHERLGAQAQRVWNVLLDGGWHTLADLAAATSDPEASVSARLRDFRKDGWGAHVVEALRGDGGVWRYRLIPRPPATPSLLD